MILFQVKKTFSVKEHHGKDSFVCIWLRTSENLTTLSEIWKKWPFRLKTVKLLIQVHFDDYCLQKAWNWWISFFLKIKKKVIPCFLKLLYWKNLKQNDAIKVWGLNLGQSYKNRSIYKQYTILSILTFFSFSFLWDYHNNLWLKWKLDNFWSKFVFFKSQSVN